MSIKQVRWDQHANPCMRVRADKRYWVIAEPATWDADDTDEYAARIYYGTFPIRIAEVGFAWGDTLELALSNAIAHLERHLPLLEAQPHQNGGNGTWGSTINNRPRAGAISRQFVEEWRF